MAKRYCNHGVKLKLTELAYAAGIIDGEGSITISRIKRPETRGGYIYLMEVKVGMTDTIVPHWLLDKFGGNLRLYIKSQGKPQFVWTVSSKKAKSVLETLLPYLKLKNEQAQTAIGFQKLKKGRGFWHEGNPKPFILIEAESILRNKMCELNYNKGRGKSDGTL